MEYRCTIEKEGDEYIAQFPDMTNVVTCGFSHDEALARDTLKKEYSDTNHTNHTNISA